MMSFPYLNIWLKCLTQLIPPRGLIHIGAGGGNLRYPYSNMPKLLAVEADDLQCAHLQAQLQDHAHCQIVHAVVSEKFEEVDFYILSQTQENGLCASDDLLEQWPNLKTVSIESRTATPLLDLIEHTKENSNEYNWSFIDCLPANGMLGSAGIHATKWDVLVVRVLKECSPSASERVRAVCLPRICEQMAILGLGFIASEEENHPNVVRALFVRNQSERIVQIQTNSLSQLSEVVRDRDDALRQVEKLAALNASIKSEYDSILQVQTDTKLLYEAAAKQNEEARSQYAQLLQENEKWRSENENLKHLQTQSQSFFHAEQQAKEDALRQCSEAIQREREASAQCEVFQIENEQLKFSYAEIQKIQAETQFRYIAGLEATEDALQRSSQLAQKYAEATTQNIELARKLTKQTSALVELETANNTIVELQSADIATKEDLTARCVKLAEENSTLMNAHATQENRICEIQVKLEALSQENTKYQLMVQQLEHERQDGNNRNELLQDELIKAEAQIDLIKDLLIRESGM